MSYRNSACEVILCPCSHSILSFVTHLIRLSRIFLCMPAISVFYHSCVSCRWPILYTSWEIIKHTEGISIARLIAKLVAVIVILLFKLSTSQRVKSSSSCFQLGKVVGSISPPLILQFFVIVTGIVFSNSIFFMECTTKWCYIRTILAVRHVMPPSSAHAFRCTVDTTTRWSDVKLPAHRCGSSLLLLLPWCSGLNSSVS